MGRTGTYYLNNYGSRWVNLTDGKRDSITLLTKSGKEVTRQVEFWTSFGNFASARITYLGKRIDVFGDTVLEDKDG